MKIISFIIVALCCFMMVSCDSNRVFEKNINFQNEKWHRDSALIFKVTISDTNAVYSIYINNRISPKYEYSNLYLFIDADMPHNRSLRDTLECTLRNPAGKILGKGFGNVWSNKIPYRKHIRFPYSGTYTFTIEQAMREDELKYILDAGIRIEKAKI